MNFIKKLEGSKEAMQIFIEQMKQEDSLQFNSKRLRQITKFETDYRYNEVLNCSYDPHQNVELDGGDSL